MTNYEINAKDFLKRTGSKMTISFKELKYNPWNEKQHKYYHNIFVVTIIPYPLKSVNGFYEKHFKIRCSRYFLTCRGHLTNTIFDKHKITLTVF